MEAAILILAFIGLVAGYTSFCVVCMRLGEWACDAINGERTGR